jgi:SAM-dependent methyltransferase
MDEDRARWDERYAGRDGGTASAPTAPEALALLDEGMLAQLPTAGRALDIACGPGGQAVWLAQRGLHVLAIDVSPVAVRLTKAAAGEHGVGDLIDARVHDLDAGLPADATGFALVVCQRFRGRDLYPQIVDGLVPGGFAIVTVLSAVGLEGAPGEFHAPAGELLAAFGQTDVDIVAQSERAGVASIVVRRRTAIGDSPGRREVARS